MTLADLKKGDRARISAVHAAEPSVQRLMVMGLVEGAELQCLGASLGGDPLEFRLYGGAVSLRRGDARQFQVAPLPSSRPGPHPDERRGPRPVA